MSFILDALKKSENARQRQSGPALFEVKVAAPKPGLPMWAVALAVLLVVNIGVVIWLVLRKPAQAQPPQANIAAQAASPAIISPAPAAVAPVVVAPPVSQAPAQQQPAPADSAPTASADEDAGDAEALNPEDYEPAVAPSTPSVSQTPHVSRGTVEGLPTYEEAAGRGGLPDLKLDMHVYAANPQARFVFINMQRMREGDSLPNGVHLDEITTDGVVLAFHGTRFVLERE